MQQNDGLADGYSGLDRVPCCAFQLVAELRQLAVGVQFRCKDPEYMHESFLKIHLVPQLKRFCIAETGSGREESLGPRDETCLRINVSACCCDFFELWKRMHPRERQKVDDSRRIAGVSSR